MSEELPIHNPDNAASLGAGAVDLNDHNETNKFAKQRRKTNIFTVIVGGMVLGSIVFQGLVIGLFTNELVVIISGVAGLIVAGTTAVKQVMMQYIDTQREAHNKIRVEINKFTEENNKLTHNVDDLEDEVMRLNNFENNIKKLAEEQGSTAQELVDLVKENRITLREQKKLTKLHLQEQLLTTVLKVDRDGDFQINDREARNLIIRMKNNPGIDLDEETVHKAITQTEGSLRSFLHLIREIVEGVADEEEEEKVDEVTGMRTPRGTGRKLVTIDNRKFAESIRSEYSQSKQSIFNSMESIDTIEE